MDSDFYLVSGVILLALSLPSFLNAFTHGRRFRLASILAVAGLGMVVFANHQRIGSYTIQDVPPAFVRVFGQFWR